MSPVWDILERPWPEGVCFGMTRKLIALVAVLAMAAPDVALGKPKRRAVQNPPQQIACTVIGCVPVPPGCGQAPGRGRTGLPTGNDIIVCPPGVAPFR
jgi:hypothetical protein